MTLMSMRKKEIISIVLLSILFFGLLAASIKLIIKSNIFTKQNQTSEQQWVCKLEDPFICNALQIFREDTYLSSIYHGSVKTFDGQHTVLKTFRRDDNQNYVLSLYRDKKHISTSVRYGKDIAIRTGDNKQWTVQRNFEPPGVKQDIVEKQLGIEEDVNQFYPDKSIRDSYTFTKVKDTDCEERPCVEYFAESSIKSPNENKEYLYFDKTSYRLLRYQNIKPVIQVEFNLFYEKSKDPIPTID